MTLTDRHFWTDEYGVGPTAKQAVDLLLSTLSYTTDVTVASYHYNASDPFTFAIAESHSFDPINTSAAESLVINFAESIDLSVDVDTLDDLTFVLDESAVAGVQIMGSDTLDPTLAEVLNQLTVELARNDDLALALAETVQPIDVTLETAIESLVLNVAYAYDIDVAVDSLDDLIINITEDSSLAVGAAVSASDTADTALVETVNQLNVLFSASDILTIALGESAQNEVSFTTDDAIPFNLLETTSFTKTIPTADLLTLALSEDVQEFLINVSVAESLGLTLTESAVVYKTLPVSSSEALLLALGEETSGQVTGTAFDDLILTLGEQSDVQNLVFFKNGDDALVIGLGENSSIMSVDVITSSDSFSFVFDEQTDTLVLVNRADLTSIEVSEILQSLNVSLSRADAAALNLGESTSGQADTHTSDQFGSIAESIGLVVGLESDDSLDVELSYIRALTGLLNTQDDLYITLGETVSGQDVAILRSDVLDPMLSESIQDIAVTLASQDVLVLAIGENALARYGYQFNWWNGSAWQPVATYVWDGSNYVVPQINVWNAPNWEDGIE